MSSIINALVNAVTPSKDPNTQGEGIDDKDSDEVGKKLEFEEETIDDVLLQKYALIVDPDKNRADLLAKLKAIQISKLNGSYQYKEMYKSPPLILIDLCNEQKFTRRQAIKILTEIMTDDDYINVRTYLMENIYGRIPNPGIVKLGWIPSDFSTANREQMLDLYSRLYQVMKSEPLASARKLPLEKLKKEFQNEDKILKEIHHKRNQVNIVAQVGNTVNQNIIESKVIELEELKNKLVIKSNLDVKIARADKIKKLFQNPSVVNAQFSASLNELNSKITIEAKKAYYMHLFKQSNGLDLEPSGFSIVNGAVLYKDVLMSKHIDDGLIVKNTEVDQDKIKAILREQSKNKYDREMQRLRSKYYDV
jgi:hypothetical protein